MEKFFKGIPGSGKIAFGSALIYIKSNIIIPKYSITPGGDSIEIEIEKLESALLKTRNQLEALKTDLQESQSAIETGYIDTTIMMLEDPLIKERVTEKIKESFSQEITNANEDAFLEQIAQAEKKAEKLKDNINLTIEKEFTKIMIAAE